MFRSNRILVGWDSGQRRLYRECGPWLALADGQHVVCGHRVDLEGRAPGPPSNTFQQLPMLCVCGGVGKRIMSWPLTFQDSCALLVQNLNLIKYEPVCDISARNLGVESPKWLLWTWLVGECLLVGRGLGEKMGMKWGSSTSGCFMRVQKCSQVVEEAQ